MKIALIRKKYTPFGGAERYIDALIGQLLDLGHEVHIFANEWQIVNAERKAQNGKLFFHNVPMIKGLSVLKVLSFALNARRLVKKERFDVIHSFERTLYQDIYRAGDGCHKEWLIQRAKYEPLWKTILVRVNPLHWAFLWIEKRLFAPENTKIVIANSRRGKEEIIKHYHFPEERIQVIYNGVDTSRFNPANREKYRSAVRMEFGLFDSDRVILFLGSGFERKGLSFALEMLAGLSDSRIKLVVAGKDNPQKYRKLANQFGIKDRVIFIGPTKEPEKLYAAADVFFLPTIYEPFSNACLEAMASGVPVVTTRVNGASEWIREGIDGYVIDDLGDMSSCRSKLAQCLGQISCKAADTRRFQLSWQEHVEAVKSIYDGVFCIRAGG